MQHYKIEDDKAREATLALVRRSGAELAHVPSEYRRDPDVVLAAVASCPEALRHACGDLRRDRGFALEVLHRSAATLAFLPEDLQRAAAAAAAAARGERVGEAAPWGPPRYGGECLRLVGYCNRWRTSDAVLRLSRAALGEGSSGSSSATHSLTVHLRNGCLSFQVISCVHHFGFRVFPVGAGADGYFKLAIDCRSAVDAAIGGHGDGHGANFFIDETPGTIVNIYVEVVAEQSPGTRGFDSAFVWYALEEHPWHLERIPSLAQTRGRQKPRFPKSHPLHQGVLADQVRLLEDVEFKGMYGNLVDLVSQARALSRRAFGNRSQFHLGHLAIGTHLTLLVDSSCTATLAYCLYKNDFRGWFWIEHLAVLEEFKRRGLGRRLVSWAADQAEASGRNALRLTAVPKAVDFYLKLGFTRRCDEGPNKDGCVPLERLMVAE